MVYFIICYFVIAIVTYYGVYIWIIRRYKEQMLEEYSANCTVFSKVYKDEWMAWNIIVSILWLFMLIGCIVCKIYEISTKFINKKMGVS